MARKRVNVAKGKRTQVNVEKGRTRQDINITVRHKRGCLGGCLVQAAGTFLLLIVLVALIALGSTAFAADTIDLAGMSYQELAALKDKINMAMWASEEWQQVVVPQGVYIVGEDIPAGHWTIKPEEGFLVGVHWSDKLDKSGTDIGTGGKIFVLVSLYSTSQPNYSQSYRTEADFVLEAGQYIVIRSGNAVFTPYEGKKEMGFK